MNRTWVAVGAVVVLVALALVLHFTQASRPFTDADREAITRVLTEQDAAWNEHKLEEFMKYYWKSPEMTFFGGNEVRKGWDETLARYRKTYQGEGKEMGKLTFSDLDIQVLGSEHAFVRGRFHVAMKKESDSASGQFTLILRKLRDGWRITHDHTS